MAITERTMRLFGAGAAILLIAGTVLTYRLREPPTRSVAGRYASDNCGVITIRGATAQYEGHRVEFRLLFDKFGLVGQLDRPLGPFYVKNLDGSIERGWLIFGESTVTAVRSNGQECVFNRVS